MQLKKTRNKLIKYYFKLIFIIFLYIFFILFCTEIVLRLKGYKPYKPKPKPNIVATPGNKIYKKDKLLGFTSLPGKYNVVLDDVYSFGVTHLDNTLRITHPLDSYKIKSDKEEVWIFGCSYTYGWAINDDETFAWQLQKMLPRYEIVNFGATGYSTLQSLIQFQNAIKERKKPAIVIIVYASFHDARNTLVRIRTRNMSLWNYLGILNQPCARLSRNGTLYYKMKSVTYREFPLQRYSAFINSLEQLYDKIEFNFYKSREVTKAIIKEFYKQCSENEIKLIVAGIQNDRKTQGMLKYCEKMGIMAVDISIDLDKQENTNYPIDGHPSPLANKRYAEKLYNCLE